MHRVPWPADPTQLCRHQGHPVLQAALCAAVQACVNGGDRGGGVLRARVCSCAARPRRGYAVRGKYDDIDGGSSKAGGAGAAAAAGGSGAPAVDETGPAEAAPAVPEPIDTSPAPAPVVATADVVVADSSTSPTDGTVDAAGGDLAPLPPSPAAKDGEAWRFCGGRGE